MADLEDIPAYLRIPQEERKAAWDKLRSDRKLLPPEQKPYRPITGAAPNDDPDA
jgi:hypothetical protein